MGDLLFFLIYVCQQLGIMLGVGAQAVLLCTHLVALHRKEPESAQSTYARVAHTLLGVGLFLMITSGLAAVLQHMLFFEMHTLLEPAFLFKWFLMVVVWVAFFSESLSWNHRTLYYSVTGAHWFALFLLHSVAPVIAWSPLLVAYALWLVGFSAIWWFFVGIVQLSHPAAFTPTPPAVAKMPPPAATPTVAPQITAPAAVVTATPSMPVPAAVVTATLNTPVSAAPKEQSRIVPPPMVVKQQPMPLVVPPRLGKAPTSATTPVAPTQVVLSTPIQPSVAIEPIADAIDIQTVPPLRVMPQRPEDIGTSIRRAVVQ